MGSKRLIWILFPAILAISLLSLGFGTVYFNGVFKEKTLKHNLQTLEQKGSFNLLELESFLQDSISNICDFKSRTNTQFFLMGMDKVKDCPISQVPHVITNFTKNSTDSLFEITNAEWVSKHHITYDGKSKALFLKLNETFETTDFLDRKFMSQYAFPGFLVLLVIAFTFSRWMTLPLEQLEKGALRFSAGDLKQPIANSPIFEIDSLSKSLNLMAQDIDDKLSNLVVQSSELKSVLASMTEGVIALDLKLNILNMNKSAKGLLELKSIKRMLKENLAKHFPESELISVAERVIQEKQYVRGDIKLNLDSTRILEYRANPLKNIFGKQIGVLLVLTDVTRLRHLENVRSDFVANVSHELRTPITSIQGYSEMLQDDTPPELQQKFTEIIHRQTLRLMDIINDLTELAKMDQLDGLNQLVKKKVGLPDLLNKSIQTCDVIAQKKSTEIQLLSAPDIEIEVNSNLLEQAVVNILSNAIKYAEPKKTVTIESNVEGKALSIHIVDQGFGIPNSHLDRIFERFYRVDKARSKDLGGTGLGLAIVNHIIRAHGGYIEVSSQVGVGSRFTLNLPIKA